MPIATATVATVTTLSNFFMCHTSVESCGQDFCPSCFAVRFVRQSPPCTHGLSNGLPLELPPSERVLDPIHDCVSPQVEHSHGYVDLRRTRPVVLTHPHFAYRTHDDPTNIAAACLLFFAPMRTRICDRWVRTVDVD